MKPISLRPPAPLHQQPKQSHPPVKREVPSPDIISLDDDSDDEPSGGGGGGGAQQDMKKVSFTIFFW